MFDHKIKAFVLKINHFVNETQLMPKIDFNILLMSRIALITLLLLISTVAVAVSAYPQDSIFNRHITVEREYKPVIQDAGKINSVPQVLEPTVEKTTPTYSDFNLPLNVDFNIHTLPAAQLSLETKPLAKGGFARIGLGNYWNTLVDFAYPLVRAPRTRLDFSLNHLATFDVKTHATTKAALSFDQLMDNSDFYAGIGGSHEFLKYYGHNFNGQGSVIQLDSLSRLYPSAQYLEQNLTNITRTPQIYKLSDMATDSTSNTFWRFNAYAGLRSLPTADGIRYLAEIHYKLFNTRDGFNENLIQSRLHFDMPFHDNRLGLDLEMFNLAYSAPTPSLLNFWNNYSVVKINPYYNIERPRWNLRLGLNSSFTLLHGLPFTPSPDIRVEWKAFPKFMDFYGGFGGNYQVNTLSDMFAQNPYLFHDVRVNDTYTPYDLYAGIKIKPLYNLLLDGFVDYRRMDNQYFFVNKAYQYSNMGTAVAGVDSMVYSNRFNVIYSGATHLKLGVRANYNFRNLFNLELKGAYNHWNVDSEPYAWNQPLWEASLNTSVSISPNLTIDGGAFFDTGRYAKLGTTAVLMQPRLDINLGTSYSYTNWFTAFLKLNNLLNQHYQDYYGYDVQGLNVLLGAAFSF